MPDDVTTDDDERQVRPFADWLIEQANGSTHAELTEGFNDLVRAVIANGKAGDLTLTVKVKPAARGSQMVSVSADVKVKPPRGDRAESLFYVDSDSNVRRNDPNQLEFAGLRDVSAPASEPKEVQPKEARP